MSRDKMAHATAHVSTASNYINKRGFGTTYSCFKILFHKLSAQILNTVPAFFVLNSYAAAEPTLLILNSAYRSQTTRKIVIVISTGSHVCYAIFL